MSSGLTVIDSSFRPQHHELEEILLELSRYGQPRLRKMSDGWYCSIEVFVTGKGVEFKVSSDFDDKAPKDAAVKCYELLLKAIQQIKDTK